MSESENRMAWAIDTQVLGEIGHVLDRFDLPTVAVRLPRPLAEQAAAAWQRDDRGSVRVRGESFEQRLERHRAGTLALIGRAVVEHGRWEGEEIAVDLAADLVALAVDAGYDVPAVDPREP